MTISMKVDPPVYMFEKRKVIDEYLLKFMPDITKYPQVLHEAIHYSVMAGGKRLRPILALAAFEACGGTGPDIYRAAVAVELIHTYSLIHDDLPCMDDDDLRRGKPSLHNKYGEAIALLAGDALHDFAFRLTAETGNTKIVLELAEAIGTDGMLAGQMADMDAEGRDLSLEEVTYIHVHKTGKLIRGAVRIGALLANAGKKELDAITVYGEKVGHAFQIIDDILDIVGDTEILGKPVGSDSKNNKATYPAIIGLEKSRQIASELIDEAIDTIRTSVSPSDTFVDIARFIGGRQM
ncbi:MAG: polyprenyl synthetase family protein [candidate division Zixibacteria bacterium]|nr:polyprenyl synthetase family protein [candidate division Zixibacteria bacterium]